MANLLAAQITQLSHGDEEIVHLKKSEYLSILNRLKSIEEILGITPSPMRDMGLNVQGERIDTLPTPSLPSDSLSRPSPFPPSAPSFHPILTDFHLLNSHFPVPQVSILHSKPFIVSLLTSLKFPSLSHYHLSRKRRREGSTDHFIDLTDDVQSEPRNDQSGHSLPPEARSGITNESVMSESTPLASPLSSGIISTSRQQKKPRRGSLSSGSSDSTKRRTTKEKIWRIFVIRDLKYPPDPSSSTPPSSLPQISINSAEVVISPLSSQFETLIRLKKAIEEKFLLDVSVQVSSNVLDARTFVSPFSSVYWF
jgi:hypothetical protein